MALKPIPRLILIVIAVAGLAFGVNKYVQMSHQNPATQAPVNSSNPAPMAGVGVTQQVAPTNQVAQNHTAGAYQSITEKGVVRVSVQSPSKPFYYVENGVRKGFNYEFLKVLFAQSEFTQKHQQIVLDTDHAVDTYPLVPKALLQNDNRGNPVVDIAIDGLTFSDDDLPGVVYSIPYIDDFGYALITSSRSSVKSSADLNGLTIGVLQGDPDVKAYVTRQFPGSKIVELSDASVNGERSWINNFIKGGKVDAIVYDYPFGVAEIAGTDLKFAVSKLPNSDVKYKIGVRKSDTQLLEIINIAIRKAKESPDYIILLRKYFMSNKIAQVRSAVGNETIYIVKKGDTLSTIASTLMGNKMRYAEIESRNNLPNPNLILVGQKLVIPKG